MNKYFACALNIHQKTIPLSKLSKTESFDKVEYKQFNIRYI